MLVTHEMTGDSYAIPSNLHRTLTGTSSQRQDERTYLSVQEHQVLTRNHGRGSEDDARDPQSEEENRILLCLRAPVR